MFSILHISAIIAIILSLSGCTLASYFPPQPQGVTTLQSKAHPSISLSYKKTHICETTPGVKSYSGYVHLPSTLLNESYNISTFFWYFPARHDPTNAPLSLYLAGGPGESSLYGAVGEGGPCLINADSNSTTLNPWSWNNHVNMLYIDQPVQTGFSYDVLVNGTLDQITGIYTPMNTSAGVSIEPNITLLLGTFPSQDPSSTARGSGRAASALWHFMQAWVAEFPHYKTRNDRISLWTNSYGGYYAPAAFAYFEQQSRKIAEQKVSKCRNHTEDECGEYRTLHLDTLGITDGCIDTLYEAPCYPEMANNNTYGLQAYPEPVYVEALNNFTQPGGCKDMIMQCRQLASLGDPTYDGTNQTVNTACATALAYCFENVENAFAISNRSAFDIAHLEPDLFPHDYAAGFFNQRWVQQELGVPLNFTPNSNAVAEQLVTGVGDAIRIDISHLEYLLNAGIKVAMVYGDRDYRCNWLGAENISLSVKYPNSPAFAKSGYADVITNSTYKGGLVRQSGSFSFSRVFQAGHAVSAYQPETLSSIFNRAIFNTDIATGTVSTAGNSSYRTEGMLDSRGVREVLPESPSVECQVWDVRLTCTEAQVEALVQGTAVVRDGVVVEPAK